MQARKTTFSQRFDKAVKFYDFTYHLHKATFKGLTSFYRLYSQAQRAYADSLISLTKQIYSQIPDLPRQNGSLLSTIKQIISCMQSTSQLHFNYSQRLLEVSSFYNAEYLSSKKKKDNQMKILKDRNQEQYAALREREKNRNALNAKQKDICKVLYDNLDRLAQEQNDRIHKIKQQTIIYFSVYKKVCQKQLQFTNEYNIKLIKQQFQVKNPKISEMAQQLRNQYNQYGGEQIQRKSYDVNQSMMFNRESLRASMAIKERVSRISEKENKLKKMQQKYQQMPDGLLLMNQPDTYYGLFDGAVFGKDQRRKYAREINSQYVKNIAYDMIEGFARNKNADSDDFLLLQLMKGNLRYKANWLAQPDLSAPTLYSFLTKVREQISDKPYLYHIRILQQLSKYPLALSSSKLQSPSSSKLQSSSQLKLQSCQLSQIVQKYNRNQITQADVHPDQDFNFIIKCCIIDTLLDSVCVSKDGENVLPEGCVDFVKLIGRFGEEFMGIGRNICVVLVLRKLDRLMQDKNTNQQLQHIFNDQYFLSSPPKQNPSSTLPQTWSTYLQNSNTQSLLHFYNTQSSFLTNLKILLTIDKLHLSPQASFCSRDHFYACIRSAGYNYLKSTQKSMKIFSTDAGAEDRLKDIVEGVEELDYGGVVGNCFGVYAADIGRLFGVGDKIVKNKLFQQFTYPLYQAIDTHMSIMSQQQGVDRQGYILRLGIILAKLDIQNPQPITQYQTFFKVLKNYLSATEKDYDNMLQHSRQTQLWIMEQNALATPNCIDFCSLLYKPFQFLLISLKELQRSRKTQYTAKYSEFIKFRLNSVLKTQIIKYINFLYESLANYRNEPPTLTLKPTRTAKPHILTKQNLQKERQNFKQLTRRLFNLIFLKQQLQEMVFDFIEPDVYKQMDNSIFNIGKLNKVAAQSPQYRDILGNIKEIVEAVLVNEERIVRRVAGVTVFYCMSKLFDNLYYQQEKNAIQQFFSNAADYKLSQHTFLKYQQTLQDWFTLIVKNIPDQHRKYFQSQFSKSLFSAIQLQILNSTKFKVPLKQSSVIQYIDADVTFLTTLMKQKFFDSNIIEQDIKAQLRLLLVDMQSETSKLMSMFESYTLKNDKDGCRYVLAILNMRVKDQKAQQFVKKYKSISQG